MSIFTLAAVDAGVTEDDVVADVDDPFVVAFDVDLGADEIDGLPLT
jgi:hypothetical protein